MKTNGALLGAIVLLGAMTASFAGEARGAIAWYGTWERGLRVAKETKRPILLIAAAPQCRGISGLW